MRVHSEFVWEFSLSDLMAVWTNRVKEIQERRIAMLFFLVYFHKAHTIGPCLPGSPGGPVSPVAPWKNQNEILRITSILQRTADTIYQRTLRPGSPVAPRVPRVPDLPYNMIRKRHWKISEQKDQKIYIWNLFNTCFPASPGSPLIPGNPTSP